MESMWGWWIWKDLKGTSRELFKVTDLNLSPGFEENLQVPQHNRTVWRDLKPGPQYIKQKCLLRRYEERHSVLNVGPTSLFLLSRRTLVIVLAVLEFSWDVIPEFMPLILSIKLRYYIQDARFVAATLKRPFVAIGEQLTPVITL